MIRIQSISTTFLALGALILGGAVSPCTAQEKQPLLLVRFVAVAKPPLPKIVARKGDSTRIIVQDAGAILPPGIMLGNVTKAKGEDKEETSFRQSLNLMLNVATRAYRVKSPALVLQVKGAGAPFAKITLPRAEGSFTVYMARQPNKKKWDNAQVIVLETPMLTTGKVSPRLVNFTKSNVGVAVGNAKQPSFARPGRATILKTPSSLNHILGYAYRQKNSKWEKIQRISAPFTNDMMVTFVCFPGLPGSQKDCLITDRIRRESMTVLAARAKKMDEMDKVSSSTPPAENE